MSFRDEAELEEFMSRPSAADVAAMAALDGDLLVLGAAGKMVPTLARRAQRAVKQAGAKVRVIGVSRFSDAGAKQKIEAAGVETITAELLDREQLARLPDAPNIIYMAGRKFGSTGAEYLTWAMNALLPAMVAERYPRSRIVAFSSGNVYAFSPVSRGGSREEDTLDPVGEYGWSVLARERVFDHYSRANGTPVTLLRLNYAIDMRYGVLLDIGTKVYEKRPVDVKMGHANVVWQGDANSIALQTVARCASPPFVLNLTGPETLSVREVALQFGEIFGEKPQFTGQEAENALLNNAGRCWEMFGPPAVTTREMIEWTAAWIRAGGPTLSKPTHFEARDGKF